MFLRQSTASQEILLGPFVDASDGVTAETALTIAASDIKLFKGGATTLADKNADGATHISDGHYYAVLDATDTNTVGILEVVVRVAGALPVRRVYQVLEEAVYDALFASGATGFATAASVADAVWDEPRADHVVEGSFGELLRPTTATIQSGTTTTSVKLDSAWNAGQARLRTLYLANRGYNLSDSSNDTYSVSPAFPSVPANGTVVQIGPLAAATPPEVAAVKADTAAIKVKTDALPASWPQYMAVMQISSTGVVTVDKTGYVLAPNGLDSIDVESGVNVRQALSPILGAAAGVLTGATGGAGTITIKGGNTNATRITATVDSDGNRTSVILSMPS